VLEYDAAVAGPARAVVAEEHRFPQLSVAGVQEGPAPLSPAFDAPTPLQEVSVYAVSCLFP